MDLPEFLDRDRYGEIRLRGHRIGLDHVVACHTRGEPVARIVARFPSLTPEIIGEVLGFYETNRAEVDAYIARCRSELDWQRENASGGPSLETLRRRRQDLASRRA